MVGTGSQAEIDLARRIVVSFPVKASRLIAEMVGAAGADDPTAARLAHSLKGAATLVGHLPTARLAADAEALARQGRVEELVAMLPRLHASVADWSGELDALRRTWPQYFVQE
jgi:HPt (histidine-containing phosphotransfer) domain-containing protein